MKYFLDTEFIEGFHKPIYGKKRHHIDLISIGIYSEDGRSLHLISNEYDFKDADKWVRENVIKQLYIDTVHGDARNRLTEQNFHKYFGFTNKEIAAKIADFTGCVYEDGFLGAPSGIEFYGYFADYDWVLFCSLFGRMIDLPKGFPMYCKDLKQMMDDANLDKEWKRLNCPDDENEHNALADARWNYKLYKAVEKHLSACVA